MNITTLPHFKDNIMLYLATHDNATTKKNYLSRLLLASKTFKDVITLQDVLNYKEILLENYHFNTVNQHLTTLKSYLRFLQVIKVTDHDYTSLIKLVKHKSVNHYPPLSDSDLSLIINSTCITSKIMHFILVTGIRRMELKTMILDGDNITILGKGNKIRIIKATSTMIRLYNDIIEFITEKSLRTFNRKVSAFNKVHNTAIKLHSIRATFATRQYIQGSTVLHIAAILGHESVNTTKSYIENLRDNSPITVPTLKILDQLKLAI